MGKENSLGKRKINCKTIIIAIQRASFESNLRLSFIKFWRKSLEKCCCKRIYSATSIIRIRQTKTLSNVKKSWHNLWGIRAAELAKDWWIKEKVFWNDERILINNDINIDDMTVYLQQPWPVSCRLADSVRMSSSGIPRARMRTLAIAYIYDDYASRPSRMPLHCGEFELLAYSS